MNSLSDTMPADSPEIRGVRPIDPAAPDPTLIEAAAGIIRSGGAVVFPTRSLYGLGVDPLNPKAVDHLFAMKRRPEDKPILLLIARRRQMESLVADIPPSASLLMDRFWPGGLTLVLWARKGIYKGLTAGTGKIGVRRCAHPVAHAICAAVGGPVTGTSANLSGAPGCAAIADLAPEIRAEADLILDAGARNTGLVSTVVDLTVSPPAILREGRVPAHAVRVALSMDADEMGGAGQIG